MSEIIKKVLLIICSIIFCVLIFELYLYFQKIDSSNEYSKWSNNSDYPTNFFSQPLEFGTGALNGSYRANKITNKGMTVFDVYYNIDDNGFRITNKTNALKRINFFGCSQTFGEGLSVNETLPIQFQNLSPSYNVKNFGFPGWGVVEALAILKSDHNTKGDINFLLTAPWHAERMRCKKGQSSSSKPVFKVNKQNKLIRSGNCLSEINNGNYYKTSENDKIIMFLKNISRYSNLAILIINVIKLRSESIRDTEIELYIRILQKINSLSATRNQKFIVGYIKPEIGYLRDTKFSNLKILDKIRESGIEVVDMTLSDNKKLNDKYLIHPKFELHPSALANYERATRLHNFLRK